MMLPTPIVHVVDDDAAFRRAMVRLLRAGGYAIQTYGSATEFLACPPTDVPGCVVADLRMPGPTGLDLQIALQAADRPLPVVFLTGHGDIPTSVQAMRRGAEDFLTKPVRRAALFAAVDRALARSVREFGEGARLRDSRGRFETLTPREREVVEHLLRGRLNKEIAAVLGTSERTIKAHRANLMAKLGVDSVAALVRLAQESRLFDSR